MEAKGSGSGKYSEGQEVLAFHGPLLYRAKVMKVKTEGRNAHYYLHYKGWKAVWDEWVTGERILPVNDANIAKQRQLKQKMKADQGKMKKGTKRKRDDTVESEDDHVSKRDIKINIPGVLKKRLVSDWEAVTRHEKIMKLPRQPCVARILTDYLASKQRKPAQEQVAKEIVEGLQTYFDRALSRALLYRLERPQYEDVLEVKSAANKKPSDVYGAEHLLRLFVKLPTLLSHTQMEEQQASMLQKNLTEFIRWFQKNPSYFSSEYLDVDSNYRRRVPIT